MQVLPAMGCVLPDDAMLIAPNQLRGSLLTRVYADEALRQAWWTAEAAAAAAAANSIATSDDSVWALADQGEDLAVDAWRREAVVTRAAAHMHALLARLFARCMWLGNVPARILMVQVVLGAALDVRCSHPFGCRTHARMHVPRMHAAHRLRSCLPAARVVCGIDRRLWL
jgi:hypothetical protein